MQNAHETSAHLSCKVMLQNILHGALSAGSPRQRPFTSKVGLTPRNPPSHLGTLKWPLHGVDLQCQCCCTAKHRAWLRAIKDAKHSSCTLYTKNTC